MTVVPEQTDVPSESPGHHSAAGSSHDQTLVILGASGDLTARLLLPGLGALLSTGGLEGLQLIGSALDDWDDDRWRSQSAKSFAAADATGQKLGAGNQRPASAAYQAQPAAAVINRPKNSASSS